VARLFKLLLMKHIGATELVNVVYSPIYRHSVYLEVNSQAISRKLLSILVFEITESTSGERLTDGWNNQGTQIALSLRVKHSHNSMY